MTKKSGLADSPFFAPLQPKVEVVTPPPISEPERSVGTLSKSPAPKKTNVRTNRVFRKKDRENTPPTIRPRSENDDDMNKSLHASNKQACMQAINH